MSARDITWGRQGGRVEKWRTPSPNECRPTATVACSCGRWQVALRDIGRACWGCGDELVRLEAGAA